MPTSTEFVGLCQSQVALLTQGLGAALSIVYLTEELTPAPDTQFVPVVAHPEAAMHWGEEEILSFLTQIGLNSRPRLLSNFATPDDSVLDRLPTAAEEPITLSAQSSALRPVEILLPKQQIILPLIYQEQMMGLLVTARADRAWSEAEQRQIEQIAQTLTAGCILDWRAQWLAQDLQQQQLLEERRNDLFDDLLHQFRNPLTALRTFGKLLVKRLRPGDSNHSVAESIVRESDRLQELLKQLDVAIDLEVEDLVPLFSSDRISAAPTVAHDREPSDPLPLPHAETRLLLGSAIDLQPHAVIEVLQPLLDSALAIAQDRQLTLVTEIPAQLPPVLIDLRALREVLSNLLDNALKYTPAEGKVYVGIQRSTATGHATSQQSIIIGDTGPGIPVEDLQHLFERHYRGVQAATGIPGTGLGLAIARDLVQQMQGEIQLFSPASRSGLLPASWSDGNSGTKNAGAKNSGGTVAVVRLVEAP